MLIDSFIYKIIGNNDEIEIIMYIDNKIVICMVEARGIEPLSKNYPPKASTVYLIELFNSATINEQFSTERFCSFSSCNPRLIACLSCMYDVFSKTTGKS